MRYFPLEILQLSAFCEPLGYDLKYFPQYNVGIKKERATGVAKCSIYRNQIERTKKIDKGRDVSQMFESRSDLLVNKEVRYLL